MFERYCKELCELEANSLQRKLNPVQKEGKYIISEGKKYLNLSSNDYLGIAENREIIQSFLKDADYSLGSASSRLLTGNGSIYHELEYYLAKIYQKDSALLFNSGYHANVGIMSALLSKKDAVFSDKLNHASIIDGVRLSGADFFRYKHLDYAHLRSLLEKHAPDYENIIIVSESLFSMDGDRADFEELIGLKNEFGAILIVDEAHAFGVYGENGLGVSENYRKNIDLIVATFGKAVGSMGAFCVGNGLLIEYLTNKSRPLIFSTALPEINIAFSYYVVSQIIPKMKKERKMIFETSKNLSTKIKDYGLQTIGDSYIVPIILGTNADAVKYSNILRENGYYLLPIRHPTVALNSSRVRISLRADVLFQEVEQIPEIIANEANLIKN